MIILTLTLNVILTLLLSYTDNPARVPEVIIIKI